MQISRVAKHNAHQVCEPLSGSEIFLGRGSSAKALVTNGFLFQQNLSPRYSPYGHAIQI
jgi:hypothetical protein